MKRANDVSLPPPPSKKSAVYPPHVSTSIPELHDKLYRDVFKLIFDRALFFNNNSSCQSPPSPSNLLTSSESSQQIEKFFTRYPIPESPLSHSDLLSIIKTVIDSSPHPSHPYYVDRSGSGLDPYGLMGDWLGTALSAIVIIYSVSPVFTMMEYFVEKKIRALIGYPQGGSEGDGMITPGAGAGNGYAVQLALQRKFPSYKSQGVIKGLKNVGRPVLFISSQGNTSSLESYCIWEGIGTDSCIKVKTDSCGRMDVKDLEKKVMEAKDRGQVPFMVIATIGTPILGGIDPIFEITRVAQEHKMWCHVDGQLGGQNIFSKRHARRLGGIEMSDSFLWSVDKGFSVPSVTSILVTRETNALKHGFSYGAPYVFSPSPLYDNGKWDKGDNTLQCTRRPDILKIWFLLKIKGQRLLEQHVDHTHEMKEYTLSKLKSAPCKFKLICSQFDTPQIAFFYTPAILQKSPPSLVNRILKKSEFTHKLKERLSQLGIMSISVDTLDRDDNGKLNSPPFFTMNLKNSALQSQDIDYLLSAIEYHGEKVAFNLFDQKCVESIPIDMTHVIEEGDLKLMKKPRPPSTPSSFKEFVSAPVEQLHGPFLKKFVDYLLNHLTYWEDERKTDGVPAQVFRTPEQLMEEFDFSLDDPNGVGTMEGGHQIMEILKGINKYSVHFSHPYFNYTLSQGLDPYTLMADYVMGALNTPSPYIFKMEEEVTREVRRLVGYNSSLYGNGDGAVVPGGSAAIQIALALALTTKYPSIITEGHSSLQKPLVAYVSCAGHWATAKGAFFAGIGLENCVQVPTDPLGRMCPSAFRLAVEETVRSGKVPFFVTVTSGTTVRGAFDNLNEIADICQKFGIWIHCDASYGGATLLSGNESLKIERFGGVDRSDSFSMNGHKVLGVVREATVLVTKKEGVMGTLDSPSLTWMNNQNEIGEDFRCQRSLQGLFPDRRENVFKFWFLFQSKGLNGLRDHVDQAYSLTEEALQEIKRRSESFYMGQPYIPPQSPHINFYYVPKSMRNLDRNRPEFSKRIDLVTHEIIRRMNLEGKVVLATKKPDKNAPSYLVLALAHSAVSFEDVLYMLDLVEFYGKDL